MKIFFPSAVLFILGSRFFERFFFNGLQTILPLYLVECLNFSQENSTLYYHVFSMFGSVLPLFAGLLGDSNIGKYRTLFCLTIVYVAGSSAIDAASTPYIANADKILFTCLGLLAIALGNGCANITLPFGGDQFSTSQSQQLSHYFSVTYLSDNICMLAAFFIVPILRHNFQCFGEDTCFPLAFTFLNVLLVSSLVALMAGRSIYVRRKPERNPILDVTNCTFYALSKKFNSEEKKTHWLDFSDNKYSKTLISDTKRAFKVLLIFLPVPVFWALDDQTSSTWVFQAMHMDGSVGRFTIKPDQMQMLDPLMTFMLVPLFHLLIYPLLSKCHLLEGPFERLTLGGLLAAASFAIAAHLELKIQDTLPQLPGDGTAQLRVFNGLNCDIRFSVPLAPSNDVIPSLGALQILDVHQKDTASYPVSFTTADDCYLGANYTFSGTITLQERKASSLFLHFNHHRLPVVSQTPGFDRIDKTGMENPKLRVLYNLIHLENQITLIQDGYSQSYILDNSTFATSLQSIPLTGKFSVILGNSTVLADIELGPAGIYTLIVHSYDNTSVARLITVTPPNSVHMLWQLPQYIIITVAEVVFIITGNELCYSQAPESMKSFVAVLWQLTDAFGNIIIIAVVNCPFFNNQVSVFLFYSVLMVIASFAFTIISKGYEYYTPDSAS